MLSIKLNRMNIPLFLAIKEWEEQDFSVPLRIEYTDYSIELFILPFDEIFKSHETSIATYGDIVIQIKNPENKFILGLKNNSYDEENYVASQILLMYKNFMKDLMSYTRYSLSIQNLFEIPINTREIFSENGLHYSRGVHWKIDNEEYKLFTYKIPQGEINPIFTGDNLVTPKSWKSLQEFIKTNECIKPEISELLELKQKAFLGETKIPSIEACALIEYKLREKMTKILLVQGVSKNKIEDSKKDIGLSFLLNLLVPLSVSKEEFSGIKNYILKIDVLRKIRNDIIHNGLSKGNIDSKIVYEGINSAIELLIFLDKKF